MPWCQSIKNEPFNKQLSFFLTLIQSLHHLFFNIGYLGKNLKNTVYSSVAARCFRRVWVITPGFQAWACYCYNLRWLTEIIMILAVSSGHIWHNSWYNCFNKSHINWLLVLDELKSLTCRIKREEKMKNIKQLRSNLTNENGRDWGSQVPFFIPGVHHNRSCFLLKWSHLNVDMNTFDSLKRDILLATYSKYSKTLKKGEMNGC